MISIGAILSTLGFVMYVDYLKGVRDNSRVQQLHGLQAGLNLYATQSKIPLPDKRLRIKYGDYPIGYQGDLDQSMREAIHYSDGGFDPKSQKDYTVFISRDRKRSQVMAYLEEQQDDLTLTADIGEYQGLYPYVVGDELGILIHTGAMVPIQDVETFSAAGEVDVSQSGSMLSILALLSNELAVSAADDLVFALVPKSSCESIKL